MNTNLGYSKRTLTDTDVLLSGGGNKPLSEFIGSISWDATNRKLKYKSASATDWTDLVTLSSYFSLTDHDHNTVYLKLYTESRINLIKGSSTASTVGWAGNGWSGSHTTLDAELGIYKFEGRNGWHVVYYALPDYAGQKVSFSFDALFDSTENTSTTLAGLYVQNTYSYANAIKNFKSEVTSNPDTWIHVYGTMTLATTSPAFGIMIRETDSLGNSSFIRIKNLKVELGENPSSWSPNPYDIGFYSLSNSDNNISINVGGITKTLLVGYATSAGTMPYSGLTGSGTTENLAILSNGTTNGWKLATVSLSSHNHDSSYLKTFWSEKTHMYLDSKDYYKWYKIGRNTASSASNSSVYEIIVSGDANYPYMSHYFLYVTTYTTTSFSYYLLNIGRSNTSNDHKLYITNDNLYVYILPVGRWASYVALRCIRGTSYFESTSVGTGLEAIADGFTPVTDIRKDSCSIRYLISSGTITTSIPLIVSNISGNASTASKWATNRSFTIGSKSLDVDGSAAVTWKLKDILNAGDSNKGKLLAINSSGTDVEWVSKVTNTDKTAVKKTTAGSIEKTDTTLISADSSNGLCLEGGTELFKIGNGTNYIKVPISHATINTTVTNPATDANATALSHSGYFSVPTTITLNNGHVSVLTWTKYKLPASGNVWTAWEGATSESNGTAGYMPAPGSNNRNKFLRGDGSWIALSLTDHTHSVKINGSTKTIAAPGGTAVDLGTYLVAYGTSNADIDSDWGLSVKTFDPIPSGTPPELSANITLLSLGNVFSRRKMLAFTYGNDNIYYRRHLQGNNSANVSEDAHFTDWVKLAHSGNVEDKATTIGTSLTTIATIAGVDITAKISSNTKDAAGIVAKGVASRVYMTNSTGSPSWTEYDTTVTSNSGKLVTSGAVYTAIANNVAGAVQYLGTVASEAAMKALTSAGKGDFARVITSFSFTDASGSSVTAHVGDVVYLTNDTPGTASSWIVAHTEIDTDTWTAASTSAAGYIPLLATGGSALASSSNDYVLSFVSGTGTSPVWKKLPTNAYSNTWKAANTSLEGYVPKLATGGGTISTQASEYVLTYVSSGTGTVTPTWKLLPSNAFNDTWNAYAAPTSNTAGTAGYITPPAYTNINNFLRGDGTWLPISLNVSSALYVGGSGNLTANAAQSTNGNVYLTLKEGSTYYKHNITGTGRASVTCDANGNITINSSGYSNFVKSGTGAAAGLVPSPGTTEGTTRFLCEDGTWKNTYFSIENLTNWATVTTNVTIGGTTLTLVWWPITPTSNNTVYGITINPSNGALCYVKSANGVLSGRWYGDDSNTTYKLTLNGTVKGTSSGTDLGAFYAVATSDATAANLVWMRNSANTAYEWRTLGSLAFAGSVAWTNVTSVISGSNKFNIVDSGYASTSFYFNYLPRNSSSANSTLITNYYFGNLGSGTANLNASNYYTTSDRSKKEDITTLSEHIRKFKLKDSGKYMYGVIAQEVESMFRLGVEGDYTVNYNSVLAYYIGLLENRVKELEDKLSKLCPI